MLLVLLAFQIFFDERLVESGIFQKTNQSLYDGEENILEDLYLY